jgi:hypothetical protein
MINMHDLRDLKPSDAKTVARRLATALKDKSIDLSHGECLDLVARQFGLKDWNVMAARLAPAAPAAALLEAPPGWTMEGFNLANFSGGLDAREKHRGRPVFWLRNLVEGESGHATVYQRVLAGNYAGKRVRFSAWLRTENVGWMASIALGTVDKNGFYLKLNSLENTRGEGPLRGTTGWSYRALVLDVPAEAHSLYYGFILRSTGEARFSGLDLETVGADVPVTRPAELDAPANLDFAG